jgi:hypothetical protein
LATIQGSPLWVSARLPFPRSQGQVTNLWCPEYNIVTILCVPNIHLW